VGVFWRVGGGEVKPLRKGKFFFRARELAAASVHWGWWGMGRFFLRLGPGGFFLAQPGDGCGVDVAHGGVVIPRVGNDDVFSDSAGEPSGPPTEGAVAEHEEGAAGEEGHLGGGVPCAGAADEVPVVVAKFLGKFFPRPGGVVCKEEDLSCGVCGAVVGDATAVVVFIAGADAVGDVVVGDVVAAADVDADGRPFGHALLPVLPGVAGSFSWDELPAQVLGTVGEVAFVLPEAVEVDGVFAPRYGVLVVHVLFEGDVAQLPGEEALAEVVKFAEERVSAVAWGVHVAGAADNFFYEVFWRFWEVDHELVEGVFAQGVLRKVAAVAPGVAAMTLRHRRGHRPLEELVAQAAVKPDDVVRTGSFFHGGVFFAPERFEGQF